MDTRKVSAEYRLTRWAQIIQTRLSSGQSVKEFCTSEDISKNAYFYWQRKLRETAYMELARRESGDGKDIVPSGWARLEPPKTSCAETALGIEVGGCRVTATAETDLELLAKVCRVLKTL